MLRESFRINQRAWMVGAALALCVKLLLSLTTVGTTDVLTFHSFSDTIERSGVLALYNADIEFNHPPFMAWVLIALNWLSSNTWLDFPFWMRLPAILADLGSLWLMTLIIPKNPRLLLLLAICPISILISGFHGNTDPVMIFLVLLAIYFLDRRKWVLAAGIALGASACVKLVGFVFVPAFFFYLSSKRERLLLVLATCATFVLLSSPYLFQDPEVIAHNVFGYRSAKGIWGFTRLARIPELLMHHVGYVSFSAEIGVFVPLLVIPGLMLFLSRRPVSLLTRCAISIFLFLWLAPGFGVQYLAWLVPFALVFGEAWALAVYTTSGLFLFLVYTYWSQGFPWSYAEPEKMGVWPHSLVPFELTTWLIIGLAAFAGLWRLRKAGWSEASASGDRQVAVAAVGAPSSGGIH